MSSTPAFQFYPKDFLEGTADMSNAEAGAYIRLLCHQWLKEDLEDNKDILTRLCQGDSQGLDNALKKFYKKKNGRIANKRLELVKKNQKKFEKKRKKAGEKGANKRWHNSNKNKELNSIPIALPLANDMAKNSSSSSSSSYAKENIKKEKEKWNQYPGENDVGEVEEELISKVIQAVKISQNILLTPDEVLQLWKIFKTESLTGEGFYQTEKKVCVHFIRWAKSQKIAPKNLNGQQHPIASKSIKELVKKYE